MTEQLFPVCAPSLIPSLRGVEDLAQHTMLVDENLHHGPASPTWDFWARQCGLTLPWPLRTRRFGQSNLVVQAAIEGLGVALGREPLVIDTLCDGRLVRPVPELTQSPLSYWLVRPHETKDSPKVGEFLNWIRAEVEAQPDIPPSAGTGN